MIGTAIQIPKTRQALLEMGTGLVRIPASWEEYWELIGKVEYNIEYQNGEIIAMGYEINTHGKIITELVRIFGNMFESIEFSCFTENRPVYIQSCHRVYNPDVFLIDGVSVFFDYASGLNAETNPFLIVEVLSQSTYNHDWENKLPCYKTLPSIEYILFVESRFPAVTVFSRDGENWRKVFLNERQEYVEIRGHQLELANIYRKTPYFE
jgi:Uma2 family endonuclease